MASHFVLATARLLHNAHGSDPPELSDVERRYGNLRAKWIAASNCSVIGPLTPMSPAVSSESEAGILLDIQPDKA
jgi:hypothetical protein